MGEILGRKPQELAQTAFKKGLRPGADRLNKGIERLHRAETRMVRSEMLESGIFPADPVQKYLLEALGLMFVDLDLSGTENLEKARQLLEAGNTMVFTPNHLSHVDGVVVNKVAKKFGMQLVDVLGKRILDNPAANFFEGGVDCVHVWPPTEIPESDEEVSEMIRMNFKATRGAVYAITHDHPLLVFLEGGRTRDGGVLKNDVFDSVSGYLTLGKNRGHYVVPISLEGTDNILPIESHKLRRGPVKVLVGEPYSVEELMSDFPGKIQSPEGKEELFVRTMGKIAELLPEEKRGVYSGPVKVITREKRDEHGCLVLDYKGNVIMEKKAVPLAA